MNRIQAQHSASRLQFHPSIAALFLLLPLLSILPTDISDIDSSTHFCVRMTHIKSRMSQSIEIVYLETFC